METAARLNWAFKVAVALFLLAAGALAVSVFRIAGTETDAIAAAQGGVARLLNDPYSAKFEGSKYHSEAGMVCGTVNAKNAYGGYVGLRPYSYEVSTKYAKIYNTDRDVELEQDFFRRQGSKSYLQRCGLIK